MTQAPASITSPRYGMVLPEKPDRVLVDVISQAFLVLDTYTASLTAPNTFQGAQVFQSSVTFNGPATFNSTVSVQSLGVAGNLNMPNAHGSASQINLGPSGAFIKAYSGDATYVHINKLTVTPGATSLASLTVNGNAQINGALAATGNLSGNWIYANGNHFWFGAGAWMRYGSAGGGRIDMSNGLEVPDLLSRGAIYAYGGAVYFEGSNAVAIIWRGDLAALYFPYGNGIYAEGVSSFAGLTVRGAATIGATLQVNSNLTVLGSEQVNGNTNVNGTIHCGSTLSTSGAMQAGQHIDIRGLYMPTAPAGDAPTHVLAQNGSGWANWYPKALFSSARLFAGKVSGVMGTNLNLHIDALGWNSAAPTFPWTGWYSIFLSGAYNAGVGSANCGLSLYVGGGLVASVQWGINNGYGQGGIGWWGYCGAGQTLQMGSWGPGSTGEHPDQQFVVAYLGQERNGW